MSAESSTSKPLLNMTILVACSAKKMVELVSGLEAMGGSVLPLPLIEVQDIKDTRPLDAAMASLNGYAWIIFSSAYGVTYFMQHWNRRGNRMDAADMPKICAVGPATARALEEHGLEVELVPERFVAEGVIEAMDQYHGGLRNLAGRRILLPRAKEARDVLPDALAAAGARVDVVPCYETVRAPLEENVMRQLRARNPDLAVFTSSSTVKTLIEILGMEEGKGMLRNATIAALGPVTASTAESFGKRPEIIAKESTVASLIQAIRVYYSHPRIG